ncbi:MAG: tetratricopeptide repeat protein, partial [Bacteroidia bacterium]|nr:tetratricopeptide repeat protein [Bacteroidia bacterium]
ISIYAHHNRPIERFPLGYRIANALVSLVTYLEKTFWPHDLAVYYPSPVQIPAWQIIGASLLIVFITTFVITMVKRLPYLFFGWLWYTITIAPVIGILQDTDQAMTDRYYYLPSIGIAVMLAWGIPFLIKNEETRKKILFPAGIVFLIIMSVLTWKQCGYWKNSIELFKHTLQVTKNNLVARNSLAGALYTEGKIEEAIYHYNEAIRLKPDCAEVYNNRAFVYLNQGNKELGCRDAQKACELGNCRILKGAKIRGFCR